MGKVDDLRAMREARYNAAAKTVKTPSQPARPVTPGPNAKTTVAAKPARTTKLRVVTEVETLNLPEPGSAEAGGVGVGVAEPAALFAVQGAEAEPEVEEELCGHRAISGKTCIRENKHAEKNHKYAKS